MDDPSVFNYLGEDIIQDQICSVVTGLQACYPIGTPAHTTLTENLSKLRANRENGPKRFSKDGRKEPYQCSVARISRKLASQTHHV